MREREASGRVFCGHERRTVRCRAVGESLAVRVSQRDLARQQFLLQLSDWQHRERKESLRDSKVASWKLTRSRRTTSASPSAQPLTAPGQSTAARMLLDINVRPPSRPRSGVEQRADTLHTSPLLDVSTHRSLLSGHSVTYRGSS
jgi:hypothetical protein